MKKCANCGEKSDMEIKKSSKKSSLRVGTILTFGQYANEDIEWRVIDIKDNKALILTDKIIEAKRFDESSNNYEKSEIRLWLNNEFYNAFTEDEKKRIIKTTIDNSIKSTCDSKNEFVCEDTLDYIFLLSFEEAQKYFKDGDARICQGTEHAIKNGLFVNDIGSGYWWLRSPNDNYVVCAYFVFGDGGMFSSHVDFTDYGIRAACWINL